MNSVKLRNTRLRRQLLAPLCAVASSATLLHLSAHADDNPKQLPEVVVSATPLGAASGMATPATVLTGERLQSRVQSTLGETLNSEPGVSSTGYGPNASRPVIRGMDGDRIRVLQNGTSVLDASGTSVDHAVALEPLFLDRVEILRGPAALMYGGSAMGGVVNAMDNRIPSEGFSGMLGTVEARTGGAQREQSQAAKLEGGNGRWMWHLDGMQRRTEDLRIPGDARSRRLQESSPLGAGETEVHGTLPNSASKTGSATLGTSLVWDQGYVGIAYSTYETRYGTVAEPDVKIGLQQQRWDVAGEQRNLGWFKAVKFKYGQSNYNHTEYDVSDPATTFKNKGYDVRLEFVHQPIGKLQGAFGLEQQQFDFSALGSEAFLPTTHNRNRALFVYEELDWSPVKLSASVRQENQRVASDTDANFGAGQTRSFSPRSLGLGAQWQFAPQYAVVLNLSSSQRAPTYQELFANGPHAATGIFEVGNTALGVERVRGVDLALRKTVGDITGSIGVYQQHFNNFISVINSGTDTGSPDFLPIYNTQAVRARFRGVEAGLRWRLINQEPRRLELELGADHTHADDLTNAIPLPRIAPTRYTVGLNWQEQQWGGRVMLQRALAQNRLANNELVTDGYTLLNAQLTYRLPVAQQRMELFLRGENLLNQEIRNHVSFLKNRAPAGARAVLLGVRVNFEK